MRFVILQHDHPFLHWDFMIEAGDVLRTWRLLNEPGLGRTIRAERISDHRKLYLDYEGPVRGDRGSVVRWDGGNYSVIAEEEERLTLFLDGQRVRGRTVLERQDGDEWQWTCL